MNWLSKVGFRSLMAAVLVYLSGCAAPPPVLPVVSGPVFYPSEPQAPRIQHLVTFSGPGDFESKRSAFSQFISGDEPQGGMVQIYGVAIDDGKLYAVDSKAARIVVFDLVKREFSMFSGVGGGQMRLPVNITIDADGTKYVTDTGRKQILRYARDNKYLGAFGGTDHFKPVDVAISGDKLYVTDIEHHQVKVLDKRTGELLSAFGGPGNKEGEMAHPTNIAIGPNGDIFVAETTNFRIQRFTADGRHVRFYGEVGDSPGKFARPKGIAIDHNERIYVSDAAFQNVQIFSGIGQILMPFGQPDNSPGLSLPAAVKIDYDNVGLFKRYAEPGFSLEYLILVTSQYQPNKIDVFGFGRMAGRDYAPETGVK